MPNIINNSEVRSKKNKTWLLLSCIFIIIAIVIIFYTAILKFNINDFNLSGHLKHPDRIPQHILEEKATEPSTVLPATSSIIPSKKEINTAEYEQDIIARPATESPNLAYELSLYRQFLADINLLLINFFQDKSYTEFITRLKHFYSIGQLKKINEILEELEEYNTNYLVNIPNLTEPVMNNQSSLLGKFIKIEKTTDALKSKDHLKDKIIKKLEILINFIYSEQLQNIFLNNNSKKNE